MKAVFQRMREASEKRDALNSYLAQTAQPQQARVTELRGELNAAEDALRRACSAIESGEDVIERRTLTDRIELRRYMTAALNDQRLTGAEKEFNETRGLSDMNTVPWEALEPRAETNEDEAPDKKKDDKSSASAPAAASGPKGNDEERADTHTPVAAAAIGHPQQPVLARIFQRSRTSFLGIRMPMVASGEPVYPVLTAGAAGDAKAPGVAIDAEAATFVGVMVGPTRLSARYLWRIEDATRFPVEDALRADIRNVMNDLYDTQIINGDGGADGDMTGIISALGAAAAEGSTTNFNQVLTKHYEYVDGKAAGAVNDVRTLMGIKTYAYLATLFQGASGEQIYSLLARLGISTATWAGIAAPASNVQQAIQTRKGDDAIAPIWQGITMIRDPYTGAAKGEVALTAHMLANFKFLRTDNWRKVAFKLA